MKTRYIRDAKTVKLIVERSELYEEDYQIHMLNQNQIAGLLEVSHNIQNNLSHFSYEVSNLKSMKKCYEQQELQEQDMILFIESILDISDRLRKYMLDPEGLLLHPNYIFYNGVTWLFVFIPDHMKPLRKGFHEITEFFVKHLDYNDIPSITLACTLHKESLEENFNLYSLFQQYTKSKETTTIGNQIAGMDHHKTTIHTTSHHNTVTKPKASVEINTTNPPDKDEYNRDSATMPVNQSQVRIIQEQEDYKSIHKRPNPTNTNKKMEEKVQTKKEKKSFSIFGDRNPKRNRPVISNLILEDA